MSRLSKLVKHFKAGKIADHSYISDGASRDPECAVPHCKWSWAEHLDSELLAIVKEESQTPRRASEGEAMSRAEFTYIYFRNWLEDHEPTPDDLIEVVQAAISSERERCARIVETAPDCHKVGCICVTCEPFTMLARAIRSG